MTDYMRPADPTVTHCYHAAKVNELIAERDAEIERLREWNREIALNAREFAAENERLRAALREIAAHKRGGHLDTEEKLERDLMIGYARAALDGQPAPGKEEA